MNKKRFAILPVFVFVFVILIGSSPLAFAGMLNNAVDKIVNVIGKGKDAYDIVNGYRSGFKSFANETAKVGIGMAAEAVSVPTVVGTASAMGVTASTGTAIASLSGAAATNATLAVIGGPVVTGLSAVGITAATPVAVGSALVVGAGF